MGNTLLYPIGCSPAGSYAQQALLHRGLNFTDHPCPEVTHLLLDVPSFQRPGILRCGISLSDILETLPGNITIIGGALSGLSGYRCFDLLEDSRYLAKNAAITAECALIRAGSLLKRTLHDSRILIIGWGRIGKCLCSMLRGMGCSTTVLARSEAARSILEALGYQALSPEQLDTQLPAFHLIINTAPETVINADKIHLCKNAVKLDLASVPGILGEDVHWTRGLPGLCTPESSGQLIGDTVWAHLQEERP